MSREGINSKNPLSTIPPEDTDGRGCVNEDLKRVLGIQDIANDFDNVVANTPAVQANTAKESDKNYVHEQSVPAAVWTIIHNLGKFPNVVVFDSAKTEVGGLVDYVDENTLTVTFNYAFGGKATLN